MAKSLVIVESPAKAKTIKRYLGADYEVEASVGHIVDLSGSTHDRLGVDLENGFKPDYEVIKGKGKVVDSLRKSARGKEAVYLATDPDREGEAIAWHLSTQLRLGDRARRVLMREITKEGVLETFRNFDRINQAKFEAQQARRILDRIVGYKVSPLLWKKIGAGLSAGRVQSIALNFIVKREREIEAFNPVEYWEIEAHLTAEKGEAFTAKLRSFEGSEDQIPNEERALFIVKSVEGEKFTVSSVERKKVSLKPPPPFITSTLQREASTKLGFSVKKTMNVAQRLYEGIELGPEGPTGLITYMRTDSVRLSSRAVDEARDFITSAYGAEFVPEKPPVRKASKDSQDAHEAIRVTSVHRTPEQVKRFLDGDQARLYELIWRRFVACQMSAAVDEKTTADLGAGKAVFRANGTVEAFAGWRTVLPSSKKDEEKMLPPLFEGKEAGCEEVVPSQHFTKPPARYNEASLVKELEKKGIGRPSTYASILSTIQDREYVNRENKALLPTHLGLAVNDYLVKDFPDIMNEKFTASVEERLDSIERGNEKWDGLLKDFYLDGESGLKKRVEMAQTVVNEVQTTDIVCEECGKPMVIKNRRRGGGEFLSCSGYPECKSASDFERDGDKITVKQARDPEQTGVECELCGKPMVIKTRRRDGAEFLACSGYPQCKNASNFEREGDRIVVTQTEKPEQTDVKCGKCGKPMVIRKRRRDGAEFLACSGYPKCRNASDFERLESGAVKPVDRKRKKSDSGEKATDG